MHLGFRLRAIALATVGLFVVAACGSSGGGGVTLASAQELRVRLTTEPASFDPGQTQWDYEAAIARQTFEALLRTKPDASDVQGAAADSYSVDSTGLVYTFKLHPGAKWSDGQAVKAADFVYGFQRLLDPRLAAPYASFYYPIKITEYFIDDETVAYAKYKSGELDMVGVPLADTEAVRTSPELNVIPELTVFWVDINVTKAPFDNPKVRLAFSQAFDRDLFIKNIEKGRGLVATTLIPKGMRNYRPDLGAPQAFNAATAKSTLASSGVSATSLNGVKFIYNA